MWVNSESRSQVNTSMQWRVESSDSDPCPRATRPSSRNWSSDPSLTVFPLVSTFCRWGMCKCNDRISVDLAPGSDACRPCPCTALLVVIRPAKLKRLVKLKWTIEMNHLPLLFQCPKLPIPSKVHECNSHRPVFARSSPTRPTHRARRQSQTKSCE